jgi:hypothetical protein
VTHAAGRVKLSTVSRTYVLDRAARGLATLGKLVNTVERNPGPPVNEIAARSS